MYAYVFIIVEKISTEDPVKRDSPKFPIECDKADMVIIERVVCK